MEIRRKVSPHKAVFVKQLVKSLVNVFDYRSYKGQGELIRLSHATRVNGTDGEEYGTFSIFMNHDRV